jgi:hypothetical protein
MAQTITIPGRRVSSAETFRTDWIARGGDCVILRVEVLVSNGDGDTIAFSLETRGEDATTVTTMTATSPSGGLELGSAGVATCLYLASTSTTAGNGSQEQVRVVITGGGDKDSGHYWVVRIFPLIFFDSARAY